MTYDWVFFDGDCALCHRFVRFASDGDRDGSRFRFAPLGGKTSAAMLGAGAPGNTVVVLTAAGRVLVKSDAAVQVLSRLAGVWPVLGRILSWVPKSLRDWGYSVVAAHRVRWFGRAESVCPLPEHPERFAA